MKEATMRQIERFKRQAFGVEVEMTGITRPAAAQLAGIYFGTNNATDTAAINGYKTWSAWDTQGREWKFSRDASIIGDDDHKCEMVTPILHYDDIDTLAGLLRAFRKAGAKSCPNFGCGVHIHVDASGHTPRTLRNLVNLMSAHEEQLVQGLGIELRRLQTYCKVTDRNFKLMLNGKKPKTMDEFRRIWYSTQSGNSESLWHAHYDASRYHMLNLHATFTKGTVEFRLFQFDNPHDDRKGGLHAGQLKSYIQFCLALNQAAKDAKRTIAKDRTPKNPKQNMLGWLRRIGFVGEEFATARKVFTSKLPTIYTPIIMIDRSAA